MTGPILGGMQSGMAGELLRADQRLTIEAIRPEHVGVFLRVVGQIDYKDVLAGRLNRLCRWWDSNPHALPDKAF